MACAGLACGSGDGDKPDAGSDASGAAPLGAVACDTPAADDALFCLANAKAGIPALRNDFFGSGAALFDADGDGDLDLFAGGDVFASVLLRNDGGGYVDDTVAAGLASLREVHGVTVGDYDNDGDPDLYLTRQTANLLLRNDGGVFTDVTEAAGVGDTRWGTTASFGDYDGDGLLDLAVANWADFLGTGAQQPNVLYHNDGDGGFSDVTAAAGVAGDGFSNVASLTDYDGDGDVDLLIANDFGVLNPPDAAWRNDGPGTPWSFTDVSAQTGLDFGLYAMNISSADYDRDGDLDYYFTNIGCNVLARHDGAAFADAARDVGAALCDTDDPSVDFAFEPADPDSGDPDDAAIAAFQDRYVADRTRPALTSWAGVWFDYDHDGWEDLFVPNGQIRNLRRVYQDAWAQPNALLHNEPDGAARSFSPPATDSGLASEQNSRTAVAGDYDGDGDLDLVVTQIEFSGPIVPAVLLYENRASAGNWLIVELRGGADGLTPNGGANRDGIGARVEVEVDGQPPQLRERTGGGGWLARPVAQLHYGLGAAATVDRVTVRWPAPSTTVDTCRDIAANQRLAIREGDCP